MGDEAAMPVREALRDGADRDRGRGRRQNGVRRRRRRQPFEERALEVELFRRGFDHKVGGRHGLRQVGFVADTPQPLSQAGRKQAIAVQLGQPLADHRPGPVELRLRNVVEGDREAGAGEHDCPTGADRA